MGCWEGVNEPAKLFCKVGPAPPEAEAEKGAAQDPLPCYGDTLGHFTPMSPLPLEQQFPVSPALKTAASSPTNSITQTPITTWFCNQLNAF